MRFLVFLLTLIPLSSFSQEIWTLESSIQKAVKISPLMGAADASINSAEGAVTQSGSLPNPTIEVTSTNKLGINEGIGGNDLTQMSISQTIPLARLSNERNESRAQLQSTRYERDYQQLLLENTVAKAFHKLQITKAKFKLAEEQLDFADRYQQGRNGRDPLVRYLSPLEKKRLIIVRELANQEVASTEGEFGEAQSGFKTLLQLQVDTSEIAPLKPYVNTNDLKSLQEQSVKHSAVTALKFKQEAAEASIDLAKGKRIPDLTLTFFRELDFLNNKRQYFEGASLGITLPLWDFNSGEVSKARAESSKIKYEKQALEQELSSKLQQAHTHLAHLVGQAESYRTKILGPAEEVLKLTNSSFKSGEVNVLSLIDASNTYFDARERYLELLYESWVELAELRLAAGLSLISSNKAGGSL